MRSELMHLWHCHPERPGSPTTGLSSLGWGSEGFAVVSHALQWTQESVVRP